MVATDRYVALILRTRSRMGGGADLYDVANRFSEHFGATRTLHDP